MNTIYQILKPYAAWIFKAVIKAATFIKAVRVIIQALKTLWPLLIWCIDRF